MSTSTERVAAGAAWLDEVAPGWERKIDLSTLDIRNHCNCVCGQVKPLGVARGWWAEPSGYEAVVKWAEAAGDFTWGIEHGFTFTDGITDAWVTLIKERFDTGALSDEADA